MCGIAGFLSKTIELDKKKLKNFKNELNSLWIHGLVHLFGHDHKKEKDFLTMKRIEKKYSSFIND